jgi:hypothetical protein
MLRPNELSLFPFIPEKKEVERRKDAVINRYDRRRSSRPTGRARLPALQLRLLPAGYFGPAGSTSGHASRDRNGAPVLAPQPGDKTERCSAGLLTRGRAGGSMWHPRVGHSADRSDAGRRPGAAGTSRHPRAPHSLRQQESPADVLRERDSILRVRVEPQLAAQLCAGPVWIFQPNARHRASIGVAVTGTRWSRLHRHRPAASFCNVGPSPGRYRLES